MERANQMRVMFIPAVAGTYYPTGIGHGQRNAAGTITADTETVSTTATDSAFYEGSTRGVRDRVRLQAVVRKIKITKVGATGPLVTLQGHGGTVIMPSLDADALTEIDWEEGLTLPGGFRVVTAGTTPPVVQVLYELVPLG